jgi:hypothetical protein
MPVEVVGLRGLTGGFALAEREVRLGLRTELREATEPVRREAEGLAVQRIRRMSSSPRWSQMRTGQTRSVVYVAPKARGVKTRNPHDPRRRPNLANLLRDRALEPALEMHERQVEDSVERLLDHVAADFNGGRL